ncbi:MAG: ADP-ribosylation factor-like protein [Promethearchaeota archaeon]
MYKIFLCGLDNSGKTSIINTINKLPNPGETTPTLSFNVSQIIIDLTEFVIFDAPGQIRFRDMWDDKMFGTEILCYVVDCSNPERFDEAKEVLDKTINSYEEKQLPLIICFHKLDIPDVSENLAKAKQLFQPGLFKNRSVNFLETTIFNLDTIMELKTLFIKIIEDEM